MARGRRRTPVRRSGGQRRKLVWARRNGAVGVAAAGAVDLLTVFETERGADLIGSTILRQIIHIAFEVDTVGATGTGVHYAGGVFDADFVDALVTGGVIGEPHRDWMFYGLSSPDGSGGAVVAGSQWQLSLDIRSGRKLEEVNENAFIVLEPTVGAVLNATFNTSLLIALS